MNWLEKEVTNIELSKKLKELGFPQDKGLFWVYIWKYPENKYIWELRLLEEPLYDETLGITEYIKAYTCSELGEYLRNDCPKNYEVFYTQPFDDGFMVCSIDKDGFSEEYPDTFDKIEANSRAKAVIWLRRTGCIRFENKKKDNKTSKVRK